MCHKFQTTKGILCVSLMCLNTYPAAGYGFQIHFTCFSSFVWNSFLFHFLLNFHDGSRSIRLWQNSFAIQFFFQLWLYCDLSFILTINTVLFLHSMYLKFSFLRFFRPVFFYFALLFTLIVQKYSNFFEINIE